MKRCTSDENLQGLGQEDTEHPEQLSDFLTEGGVLGKWGGEETTRPHHIVAWMIFLIRYRNLEIWRTGDKPGGFSPLPISWPSLTASASSWIWTRSATEQSWIKIMWVHLKPHSQVTSLQLSSNQSKEFQSRSKPSALLFQELNLYNRMLDSIQCACWAKLK